MWDGVNRILQQIFWCAGDALKLKALYRRGEAYRGLGQLAPAASDLEHALRLSEGDAEQEAAIREKLDDVQEKMAQPACAEDGVLEELSAPGVRPCQNSAPKAGIIIEEITDDEVRGRKKCGDWKGVSLLPPL